MCEVLYAQSAVLCSLRRFQEATIAASDGLRAAEFVVLAQKDNIYDIDLTQFKLMHLRGRIFMEQDMWRKASTDRDGAWYALGHTR